VELSIPTRLWAEYAREMEHLWPRSGRSAALRHRRRSDLGELETAPLVQEGGRTIGFALYVQHPRVGGQGEAFFLSDGHRSLGEVRSQLRMLMAPGKARLVSLPAPLPGVPWGVERRAMTGQGFRWVERRRLFIDPRRSSGTPCGPPGFRLRPMGPGDLGAVLRLDTLAYRHHIDEAFGPGADVGQYGEGYLRSLFTAKEPAIDFSSSLVALGPRGPVGQVLIVGQERPHLQDLAVDPAYRGRGIASWLVREALQRLAGRDVERVTVGVTVENPAGAYRLYRRLGFHRDRTPDGRMPGLWVHETVRRRLRLAVLGDQGRTSLRTASSKGRGGPEGPRRSSLGVAGGRWREGGQANRRGGRLTRTSASSSASSPGRASRNRRSRP
jgi:ribosomal protein S18 acetylase RimI-like enzyme